MKKVRVSGRSQSIVGALPTGLLLKLAGAVLNFLTVPIALHLLGEKTYAAFAAILGFAGWLALGGAGLGYVTAMATAGHAPEEEALKDRFWQAVISNLLGVLGVSSLLILPFHAFVGHLLQDARPEERSALQLSAYYCFFAFALSAASVAFEGKYIGLLRSNYCNAVRLIGQLFAILALIVLVPLFPTMLTITVAMTLGTLSAALWFVARGMYDSPPPPQFRYDPRKSFFFFLQGFAYLAVSLAVGFYAGGSLPLFAFVFGNDQLATASVMAKVVQLYFSLTSTFLIPLGAALKQAIVAGDFVWARRALFFSMMAVVAGSGASALMIFFLGAALIKLWTGVDLPALGTWILPLAVLIAVTGWYHFWVYVCFAFEGASPVAICALLEVVAITLGYFIVGSYFRPSSSAWITAAAMMLVSGSILPIRIIRIFRKQVN